MSDHFVFVYGTLKEGFPNFHINKGERVPGLFKTKDLYPLHLAGERYSVWLLDNKGVGKNVIGQVFLVTEEILKEFDRLERIHEIDGYRREKIIVVSQKNEELEVFVYLKPTDGWDESISKVGTLSEYTESHAKLYKRRT